MDKEKTSMIYFADVKESMISIKNEYSELEISLNGGIFYLNFRCNLNGDANNIVYIEFPLEDISEFGELIKQTDTSGMLAILDETQNVEIQVGLDVAKNILLFFEVIDYGYEHSAKLPNEYSLVIDSRHPKFGSLLTLYGILIDFKKKKGDMSGNHENRFDKIEYQRSSGL